MNHNSNAGRPSHKFEINFREPLKHIERIKAICKNDTLRANVKSFSEELLNFCENKETKTTQTDNRDILSEILENSSSDLPYIVSNLWLNLMSKEKLKLLMMFYSDLKFDDQCDFFSFLGHSLNDIV